jgi:hypothetical protein
MTVLIHPGTGGEFDAPPRAVGLYARSGWVRKDAANGQAASQAPPDEDTPGSKKTAAAETAGGSESAGDN